MNIVLEKGESHAKLVTLYSWRVSGHIRNLVSNTLSLITLSFLNTYHSKQFQETIQGSPQDRKNFFFLNITYNSVLLKMDFPFPLYKVFCWFIRLLLEREGNSRFLDSSTGLGLFRCFRVGNLRPQGEGMWQAPASGEVFLFYWKKGRVFWLRKMYVRRFERSVSILT